MQTFETVNFGKIQYEEERVVVFPSGLPGFAEAQRFLLLAEDGGDATDGLFFFLQSLDDGELAFTLIDVYRVLPDYNPLVEPEELEDLGTLDGSPLEIYNIAVIPDDYKQMRVNLRAPIVINPVTRKGRQVIVSNEEYNIKHYIFNEIEQSKKNGQVRDGDAGADT